MMHPIELNFSIELASFYTIWYTLELPTARIKIWFEWNYFCSNFAIHIHAFIIIMMSMQKLIFENSEKKHNQGHFEKCSHLIFREICDFSKYFKSLVIKSVITKRKQLLVRTKNLNTCQPIITQSYYVKPILTFIKKKKKNLTLNQFWHDMQSSDI